MRQPGSCALALCDGDALSQRSGLKLHTSHYTLHTSHLHFTLHTSSHLISSELSSPHLSSSRLISSHLISSHMSSKFFSTAQLEHCSTLLISSKLLSIHLSSSACHKAFTATEKSLAHKNHCKENLDAATTMRSADTDLRNTEELRATASEIAAPQPDLDAKAEKRRF